MRYRNNENLYVGEVNGFGYAFIPGGKNGIVLLDLETKKLLDQMPERQPTDEKRIKLLYEKEIIRLETDPLRPTPILDAKKVSSIGIWLHLTNSCNLACPYCYIVNKGPNQHMPLSTAKVCLEKIEETVHKHQLKMVTIRLAGGEPTLYEDAVHFFVEEMKNRFSSKGVAAKCVLITNGTILNSKWCEFLSANSISVSLSLDGMGEWHNQTRFFSNGKGSFSSVMTGISNCKRYQIIPTILTTITEDNLPGIPALAKFLIDEGLPFRFNAFRNCRNNNTNYLNFIDALINALGQCYDYYAFAIREGKASFKHQLAEIHIDRRTHLRSCGMGHSGMAIDNTGKVFLCQAKMDAEPIGKLQDSSTLLEMAWNQNTIPDLRGKSVFDYEDCRHCQWAPICGGGCPIVNSVAHGMATKASPYCKLFKNMIPRLIELKALSLISKFSLERR
ncbi:MAG TPA: radical SAM protein [Candidatus Paceibacterota bacterium]|nr:radical SAM protein [Candidatus Paceibacterota bacterium]